MRKALVWAGFVAGMTALASSASAAVLIEDNFNRADGTIEGSVPSPGPGGTWAVHSGAGGTAALISGNALALAQGGGSREDVNSSMGVTAGAGDVFYAGFDLTVPDPGAAITATYFAHFMEGTSTFTGRVWITAPTSTGYRLAISNDASITDNDGEVFTADLEFGTTYRIVSSYDYSNAVSSLWVNPVTIASPSITASDPGFSDEVTAYAFRQATGNTSQIIDNLLVATTFAEAVPEPTTVGLLALGGVLLRRRSR